MPLDYRMLHTAVHITDGRRSLGTGFCVTVKSEVPQIDRHGYLLTAYHVIHNKPEVYAEVPNPYVGGEVYPAALVADWRRPLGT